METQVARVTEENKKSEPKSFNLRAPSKAEIKKFHDDKREKAHQEHEAKRAHDTALLFVDRLTTHRVPGGCIETAGWVYDPEQSGDDFVTLKKVRGPGIPREQKIPTKGFDEDRREDLEEFLKEAQRDPECDSVQLRFTDPIS